MQYDIKRWRREEWCTDTRYYLIELKQDLFGNWLCCRQWRGIAHKSGRRMEMLSSTFEEALTEFDKHRNTRIKKGYRLVVE